MSTSVVRSEVAMHGVRVQNTTVTVRQVVVPVLHPCSRRSPSPRWLSASFWDPSLTVVRISAPSRTMSTLVAVAPDHASRHLLLALHFRFARGERNRDTGWRGRRRHGYRSLRGGGRAGAVRHARCDRVRAGGEFRGVTRPAPELAIQAGPPGNP